MDGRNRVPAGNVGRMVVPPRGNRDGPKTGGAIGHKLTLIHDETGTNAPDPRPLVLGHARQIVQLNRQFRNRHFFVLKAAKNARRKDTYLTPASRSFLGIDHLTGTALGFRDFLVAPEAAARGVPR